MCIKIIVLREINYFVIEGMETSSVLITKKPKLEFCCHYLFVKCVNMK